MSETYIQKLYTAEQLDGLHLPGYHSPATLSELVAPDSDWQQIISLSIYSENPATAGLDVMTHARRKGSITHEDVISTLTCRYPTAFAAPMLASKAASLESESTIHIAELNAGKIHVAASYRPNPQEVPNRTSPFVYLAHEPLMRKLAIGGEGLQHKHGSIAIGNLSLKEVAVGFSFAAYDEATDTPLWEPLVLSAGALLLYDRSIVPTESAAYHHSGWISTEDFLEGATTKDPRTLLPSITDNDIPEVCARGTCLLATADVTKGTDLRQHLDLI